MYPLQGLGPNLRPMVPSDVLNDFVVNDVPLRNSFIVLPVLSALGEDQGLKALHML